MRYYVLCMSEEDGVEPYILAEVVTDVLDAAEDRESTLAGAIAGPQSLIVSEAELATESVGRTALAAWNDRDDSEFERETAILMNLEGDDGGTRLRLVPDAAPKNSKTPASARALREVADSEVIVQGKRMRLLTRSHVREARRERDAPR